VPHYWLVIAIIMTYKRKNCELSFTLRMLVQVGNCTYLLKVWYARQKPAMNGHGAEVSYGSTCFMDIPLAKQPAYFPGKHLW
jgi:hypothetical protein